MLTASYPRPDGSLYQFEVHPIGTAFNPIAGVYVFVKPTGNGTWDAFYVGETGNLNERLNTALQRHQAWPRCCQRGATHIAVLPTGDSLSERLTIETYLRHQLRPPCNDQ
jgi:hypothetical protein